MRFIPIGDFWSKELKSQYCKDMVYEFTEEKKYDKLRSLIQQWVAENKIKLG